MAAAANRVSRVVLTYQPAPSLEPPAWTAGGSFSFGLNHTTAATGDGTPPML